jgi:hypothetical protein
VYLKKTATNLLTILIGQINFLGGESTCLKLEHQKATVEGDSLLLVLFPSIHF